MQNDHDRLTHFLSTNRDLPSLYNEDPALLSRILTTPTLLNHLIKSNNLISLTPVTFLTTSHLNKFIPFIGTILGVTPCYACKQGVYFQNDQFFIGKASHNNREVGMSEYTDAFYFNIQSNIGRTPRSFEAYVEGIEPHIGSKIRVWGVYRAKYEGRGYPSKFKTVFHVYHLEYFKDIEASIEVDNELNSGELNDEERVTSGLHNNNAIFKYVMSNNIVSLETFIPLFAPTVFGHSHIKQALLLQLLGGSSSSIRSSIHILLVGDPSVSKSMLLRFVSKTFDCLYASGKGVTNAGLTVSIVDKKIMPGALVLSNFVCCIDEFTQLDCLYEAMEQQSVSVNKGGVSLTVKIRCGVLAACNEIEVEEALKTRFDLVFVIKDTRDFDCEIVKRVMDNHCNEALDDNNLEECGRLSLRNISYLKDYIIHCRGLEPKLTREAQALIIQNYLGIRRMKCMLKITPRTLESFIRLSCAHAKLRMSEEVTSIDVNATFALFTKMLNFNDDENGDNNAKKVRIESERDLVIDVLLLFKEDGASVQFGRIVERLGIDEAIVKDVLVELDREEIIMFCGDMVTFIN